MTLTNIFSFLILFPFFALSAEKTSFQIRQTDYSSNPGQAQSIQIDIQLPAGFHAYSDQFKIVQLLPGSYKIGQMETKPEVNFYDKNSKKTRKGIFEKGQLILQIESPLKITNQEETVQFDLRYQICSEKVCYLPQTEKLSVHFNFGSTEIKKTQVVPERSYSLIDQLEIKLSENIFLAYLIVFLAGILTSFTPCIFPMIPITLSILGHHAEKNSRLQNLLRSLLYVLGIALTYASLGVVAAVTGSLFGQALTNKYVLLGLALLFITMALSMWGAFHLQVPAFLRNKFGSGKSHGYLGAFIMGMVAGIVASPCVGPVLVSILTYVSTTQNIFLGFTLLFTYACGLGLIFILIGLFSQVLKVLPRSGPWMDAIKFILGLLMILAALYYLKFVLPENYWFTFSGLTFVAISAWQGAFHFRRRRPFRQSFFLALFIFSMTVTLLSLFKMNYLQPVFRLNSTSEQNKSILWSVYSDEALALAKHDDQPVMLDFFAEWCGACHELEDKTYSQAEFGVLSKQFRLIKIDATEDTPAIQAILARYEVKGLPTVIFMNKKGEILKDLTFTQYLDWKDLKPKMLKALE